MTGPVPPTDPPEERWTIFVCDECGGCESHSSDRQHAKWGCPGVLRPVVVVPASPQGRLRGMRDRPTNPKEKEVSYLAITNPRDPLYDPDDPANDERFEWGIRRYPEADREFYRRLRRERQGLALRHSREVTEFAREKVRGQAVRAA